jgi:hypothetical protein
MSIIKLARRAVWRVNPPVFLAWPVCRQAGLTPIIERRL